MDNVYTAELNRTYLQEKQLNENIEEAQERANMALSDLHGALVSLNELKSQEGAVLLDLQAFLERVQEKVVKVDTAKVQHKRAETLQLIENISWSVSRLLDLNAEIVHDLSGQEE